MKTKLKARRMWANYYADGAVVIHEKQTSANYLRGFLGGKATPVAVIPLHDLTTLGDSMVSALTSLGVLPKPRKGRK